MLHRFDDISGAGFALRPDHGCAFGDTTEGFAQVPAAADEGDLVVVFGDVVEVVGGSEDFGFIDVVNANGFEDLFIIHHNRVRSDIIRHDS